MDETDTVLAYENKGKSTEQAEQAGAAEGRDPLMSALNNLNRVQQLEIIHGKQMFIEHHYLEPVYKQMQSFCT